MKKIILGAGLVLAAAPVLAQSVAGTATPRATDVATRPMAGPVVVTPRQPIDRPDRPPTDRQQLAAALAAAQLRATNAVANGASPERVRSKLQDYKQQLIRQYNAGH